MKINKILAAGVAATLAVTSLSAAVSAEVQTKTFEVYRTEASFWNHSVKFKADLNKDIAAKLRQAQTGEIRLKEITKYVRQTLNYQGFLNWLLQNDDKDKYNDYAANPAKYAYGANLCIGAIKITATGYQHIGDTSTVTKTFSFEDAGYGPYPWHQVADSDTDWKIVILKDDEPIYHDGEFASYYFTEITSLELDIQLSGKTGNEDEYNYWAWMGTDKDDAKNTRYVDIGDIAVLTTPGGAVEHTYGQNPTNNNTDIGILTGKKAVEQLTAVGSATAAAPVKTDVDKGVIIGAQVTTTDIGSPIKSNQTVAQVTGNAFAEYKTALAADYDKTKLTAVTAAGVDCSTTPCVFNGEGKCTGYLYTVKYDNGAGAADAYYWSATDYTKMTDAEALAAVQALTNLTKTSIMTAKTADAVIEVKEFDARPYRSVVPANATKADAAGTPVMLKSVDGKYSYQPNTWSCGFTAMNLSDTDSTAHLLAYAFANGGWYASKSKYGDYDDYATKEKDTGFVKPESQYKQDAAKVEYDAYVNLGRQGEVGTLSPATAKENGWLPKTTNSSRKTIKNKIERTDVWELSTTQDYASYGKSYGEYKTGDKTTAKDGNQTYAATFWDGTNPYGFAGLASQVADFFNKQNNGTITFTFQAGAGATSGKWTDGIPSTEVGLKGFTSEYLNDFALFFNYNNTSGTMLSALKLDATAGTVTFDISDFLSDCGGLTKATLENIYYGLDNGLQYKAGVNVYGLWVSKVELAYDDAPAAAADAATEDDAAAADDDAAVDADDDDDTAAVVDDDDDDDDDDTAAIEDDDDDDDDDDTAAVISDDDEDDTAAAGDTDMVEPAGNDTNPATGVGLAVIPAIVAAAAMAISKKRK